MQHTSDRVSVDEVCFSATAPYIAIFLEFGIASISFDGFINSSLCKKRSESAYQYTLYVLSKIKADEIMTEQLRAVRTSIELNLGCQASDIKFACRQL